MLKYKPPIKIIEYECQYCKCRFNSEEEHDKHYKEQHGKHGMPFCISMAFPPIKGVETNE